MAGKYLAPRAPGCRPKGGDPIREKRRTIITVFLAVLFFLLGAHGPAFFWLVGLIVLVLFMIADFSRRNATAAWLSAPYLLWLLFAAYLNLGIWLLNR